MASYETTDEKTKAATSDDYIRPGDGVDGDEYVTPEADLKVIKAVKAFKDEADLQRRTRIAKSRENVNIYNGKQDWTHKLAGQSAEFLPLVPMAVEQISSFIKKALVSYGDWFSVDVSENPLVRGTEVVDIVLGQLNTMSRVDDVYNDFPTLVSDAIKVGLLQSLIIFKVYTKTYQRKKLSIVQSTKVQNVPMMNGQM